MNKSDIKHTFAIFVLSLIILTAAVIPASADTSVKWTQDIGDVTSVDMALDGSIIYASVQESASSSTIYVYDNGGVEQNTFNINGVVQKIVCTDDGSMAAAYADNNVLYFINNGMITWTHTFSAITDIDLSNAGSVLIVENSQFHKYLVDGSVEYDSSSGTYNNGVIDPDNEFAIVQSGNSNLQKYILSTTNQYWDKSNNRTFNTAFQDYQNLLILYTNLSQSGAIIISNDTLGEYLWNQILLSNIAISDSSLTTTGAYNYFDTLGSEWSYVSTPSWAGRNGACSWVIGDKMYMGGGQSGNKNDVWVSSDGGVTWTQQTASASWAGRYGACSWVIGDKMYIGGGYGGGSYKRDVWVSSDGGVTWTQQTASASWAGRYYACSWVVRDKMYIGGGLASPTYYDDVWVSTDGGVTWTRQTASASGAGRYYACSWVIGDKMYFGGGRTSTTPLRDVRVSDGLSYWINPSTTNETWIFYNYTGNNPQHTQTKYNSAVNFSGTYELRTKPTLSIYSLQTTKTLTGIISALSLSDRGDWLGTATASYLYHDQITNAGFGTEYTALLGSTGTVYDIATANGASMSVVGQGQITDIYSQAVYRVGTYTAGGAIQYVDIADRNALWATSGGEDGKVYIFSKDASSNWYLEYSSDSEDPVTALRMSSRGEYILAGRTSSLTLYQTTTPEITTTEFWFTLYAYKDSDSYRNAAINVTQYIGNQWKPLTQGLTDSAGKYVILLTAGQTYKFDVGGGQKAVVVMASPSVTSQTVNIYTTPISAAITYEATWDADINGIDFKYNDNSGQTNSVTVKVQRTDTWETVYEQTFTGTQSIDEQLPIVDDTTSYKVEFSANRVSGVARNTYVLSPSRDIIPIPLDQNIKNVLFSSFLILLAGLFSYMSAIRGSLVVAFSATLFVYLGWLTIPWHWLIIAIVIAVVAGFTQRRG